MAKAVKVSKDVKAEDMGLDPKHADKFVWGPGDLIIEPPPGEEAESTSKMEPIVVKGKVKVTPRSSKERDVFEGRTAPDMSGDLIAHNKIIKSK